MKKIIAALALLCVFASGAFGQMLNTRNYLSYFSLRVNEIADSDIVWEASDEEIVYFGTLNWDDKKNDDTVFVDTPLEFALLSYYSQPVLNIRPAEADAILPANNPRQADLKLGAAVFQEIQILRFLGNTAAEGRHRGILKFITDRRNVTEAEVETYYRNNIRGLVSDTVDENIAKSRFGAPTAQALVEIKNAITQFFLNPTLDNLLVLHQRNRYYANTDGNRGLAAADILRNSVYSFNLALGDAMLNGRLPARQRNGA
jgi:hypothetical protein